MLKLSNKGIYGIKALYELARNYDGPPVNIREISNRHGLPVPFLEQVLHQLKNEGLVTSKRGIHGGYLLARQPDEITLGDVIRALEGPIALCECLIREKDDDDIPDKARGCITSDIYRRIGEKVSDVFDSFTLQELLEEDQLSSATGTCT